MAISTIGTNSLTNPLTGLTSTTITTTGDASISGLTVGKGGGAVVSNTALGYQAALNNTTNVNGVFVGYQAGLNNANDGNTAVGYIALKANTSGSTNAAIGAGAMASNTSGVSNTAVGGVNALTTNTTGSYNVAVGSQSLNSNTTASNNTAVGYQALYTQSAGTGFNQAFGYQAGYSITTGSYNAFMGRASGADITTGSKNTIIGSYTGNGGGLDIRTASNYIVLSDGDGNPRLTCDSSGNFLLNGTQVGQSGAFATYQSNGSSAYNTQLFNNYVSGTSYYMEFIKRVSGANTQVGSIQYNGTLTVYATTSDYRLKENVKPMVGALATVAQLKPVTYDWIENKVNGQGFIAHELQAIIPDAVVGVKDAVDSEGNPQYQQIDTSVLVATLVSAIQELKAEFDAYKASHP